MAWRSEVIESLQVIEVNLESFKIDCFYFMMLYVNTMVSQRKYQYTQKEMRNKYKCVTPKKSTKQNEPIMERMIDKTPIRHRESKYQSGGSISFPVSN